MSYRTPPGMKMVASGDILGLGRLKGKRTDFDWCLEPAAKLV
jgi:hypothetical protein